MDAFERSAEDELGCLGSDSDGEASHDAEAPAPPRHREWSDEEKGKRCGVPTFLSIR